MAPEGKSGGLGKYNENRDERGRFATADNAVSPGGSPKPSPQPPGIQVAMAERPEFSDEDKRTC